MHVGGGDGDGDGGTGGGGDGGGLVVAPPHVGLPEQPAGVPVGNGPA